MAAVHIGADLVAAELALQVSSRIQGVSGDDAGLSPTDRGTQTVCLAVPLLPGTTSTDREEMLSCWSGERAADHAASRRRHGITRESVWIQSTHESDVAVVLLESPDVAAAMLGLATSRAPFDTWFRDHVRAVHGLDLADGMAVPEQILDFRG